MFLALNVINAEVRPKWDYRFEKTLLFPCIDLQSNLEMEFKISEVLGIPMDFDDKDFLQFHWIYRRVLDKIKQDANRRSNNALPGIMGV